MFVLANEMFDSPPRAVDARAWVLPVFVRLQPGKEELETFSEASRSRILRKTQFLR